MHMLAMMICEAQFSNFVMHVRRFRGLGGWLSFQQELGISWQDSSLNRHTNSEFFQVGGGVCSSSSSRCCGCNRSSCVHMLAVLICEAQFSSSGMHIGRFGGLEGRPSF